MRLIEKLMFVSLIALTVCAVARAEDGVTKSNKTTNCTDEDLKDGEAYFKTTNARYQQGTASEADLHFSTYVFAQVKWCAGKISKEDYCSSAKLSFESLKKALKAEADIGARTSFDLGKLLLETVKLRHQCND